MTRWQNWESLMIRIVVNELNNMWYFIHLCFCYVPSAVLLFLSIELKKESKVIISCHKTGTIAAFLITPAIPLVLEASWDPAITWTSVYENNAMIRAFFSFCVVPFWFASILRVRSCVYSLEYGTSQSLKEFSTQLYVTFSVVSSSIFLWGALAMTTWLVQIIWIIAKVLLLSWCLHFDWLWSCYSRYSVKRNIFL